MMDPPEVEAQCPSAEMARSSLVKIRILVVDDDSTALLVVTEVLRRWNYEVTGVMHPMEAISTLRMSRGLFDLIVTDYHMPVMNGIELQQRVQEEFDLPVIMMSGDNNEYVMLKSLECGAAFFILKPVKPVDCKNIWQYAVARSNKGKSIMVPKSIVPPATAVPVEDPSRMQALVNVSRRGNGLKTKARSKTKAKGQVSMKKPKVAWTNFLHNRFLQAVNFIGIEKAVPKKILELMNIPGLTRQNVASHLQKYRIFLRRVTEKGREHLMSSSNVLNLNPGLFFTVPQSPSMISSATRCGYPHLSMSQLRSPSLQHGLHRMSSPVVFNSCSTLDANRFPPQEAASGSWAGLGQQLFGTTNDAHALLRSSIPSFRMDLLKNTRDLSQHSAASDISTVSVSKQVIHNQSIQASQGLLIPPSPSPSPLDCSSWKHELRLGSYSGSHGNTAFPINAYPSGTSSGNTGISKGFRVNTSEEQLSATNQQLNNGITDRGLMGPASCDDQKEQGENVMVGPRIIYSNPSNNSYTPQLSDGDLFDILSDQWLNLDNEEMMLQATAFINDSIEDHRVAEENAPWDYDELLGRQPAAAEPGSTHQMEQITISGNDASQDFDFDDDFIKCLLASPTMD